MMIQLDLFPENDIERLEREIDELKAQNLKLRKSFFARHTALEQMYFELNEKLKGLENERRRKNRR